MPPSAIQAPLREARVQSADGTSITYYVIGTAPRTWLMPPAMGAPLVAMRHIIERVAAAGYTIVTWDQRGFYNSAPPADPDAMRVEDHLLDMEAVVAAAGLTRFALGGWSMAVQLSLEYHHRHPESVQALLLVNGPYERAISSAAGHPLLESLLIGTMKRVVKASDVINPLARRAIGAKGMASLLRTTGVVARAADPAAIAEMLADFSQVHWGRYFTMTRLLHEHSAAAYLSEIRVPTLITTGTRDLITPPDVAERMHRAIAGSELLVVPDATHYIVAEFPELLAERILGFLGRVS